MLDRLLAETAVPGGFVLPTPSQVNWAEALFSRLLQGDASPPVVQGLAALGFDIETPDAPSAPVIVREQAGRREGKGTYVLGRPRSGPVVVLQAPHRFFDRGTGVIAARLFEEAPVAALAWNDVPRRYEDKGRMVDADLARLDVHYLTAFTRAVASIHPQSRIVQLHGFEPRKRKSATGSEAAVIISNGTKTPSPTVRSVAACLRSAFPGARILIFPEEVDELGAMTNRQGAALRSLGSAGFLHLEMSSDLRARLQIMPATRKVLARCLFAGMPQ
ncbi:MAG: hypothetical protein V4579_13485 [Pseudomonadota bacterium]